MRRAATRKISRIKTTHGVHVSGTEFDPRRSTTVPKRYTERQLQAYRDTLANFLSRSTQFVPDAGRQPMPRAEYRRYKELESTYRNTAGSVYERIKNVELPSGETIAQRLAKMDVLHKRMHNPTVNAIFDPHERESLDITSIDALRKLTKNLERDTRPETISRKIREARQQFAAMMNVINIPEMYKATESLTNEQFVALWNHTAFASAISLSYEASKKMLSPKEESWGHEMLRQQMGDAMNLVNWARSIKI